jgi:hypothetical protein
LDVEILAGFSEQLVPNALERKQRLRGMSVYRREQDRSKANEFLRRAAGLQ